MSGISADVYLRVELDPGRVGLELADPGEGVDGLHMAPRGALEDLRLLQEVGGGGALRPVGEVPRVLRGYEGLQDLHQQPPGHYSIRKHRLERRRVIAGDLLAHVPEPCLERLLQERVPARYRLNEHPFS